MLRDEYKLREHQEEGIATLLKRDGNIIYSHPVGSGKTMTSIGSFQALRDKGLAQKALIVAPASLRENYAINGIKKFTTDDYTIFGNKQEVSSDKTGKYSDGATPTKTPYAVISYEMFRKDPEKYIKAHKADLVVFDEFHRVKNDTSQIFKSLKDSRKHFKYFVGMTGSITSNSPADIVPLVDAMTDGDHRLGSKASFENRFISINPKTGEKTIRNPQQVRVLLAPYVHHVTEERMNSSVAAPPKKVVNTISVELDKEHAKLYRYVLNELDPITKFQLETNLGKFSQKKLDAIFAKLIKARQVLNAPHIIDKGMTVEQSAEASAKVRKLMEDVETHLKTTPDAQVIVHSNFINGGVDVIGAGLKKRGIDYGVFLGKGNSGVSEKSRQQAVQDYNSGKKKVIVISAAGGEGLDLPNTTMFATLDGHWNPEKINQVEARGVRSGGQSHRDEKDRKVIINRYVSKIPISKAEVATKTYQAINPFNAMMNALKSKPIIENPFKRMDSVDNKVYEVAKLKAKSNEGLKSLLKTSALGPGVHKTKDIMNDYMDEFGPKLETGDYQGKYIDQAAENKYIKRLRTLYAASKDRNNIALTPNDPRYTASKTQIFTMAALPVSGTLLAIAAARGMDLAPAIKDNPYLLGPLAGIPLGVGTLAGLRALRQTYTDVPKTTANKLSKLSDEDLLKLLRGEVITEEVTRKKDYYIK